MADMTDEPVLLTTSSADGTSIGYLRRGRGTALIMVHGALMDHNAWNGVAPLLRESFTTYAIDRRGHAPSGDTSPYSVEREVEDIVAVATAVGGPVSLLGHSSGATLSLMAVEAGLVIDRLLLYEPPIILPGLRPPYATDLPDRLQAMVSAGEGVGAVSAFLREGPLWSESDIERLLANDNRRSNLAAMAQTAVYDAFIVRDYVFEPARVATIGIPTLYLLGETSPRWRHAGAEALAAALPDCRLVVLPGQEHIALQRAPELVAKEVERFLVADRA
jgi:pimeloyl-ACP methyl ester carboxylesterase